MSIINVRIEEKLKKQASKTLSEVGLDLSSAIKVFLNQVVHDKGLPFRPSRTPLQIRKEWDDDVKNALETGISYSTIKKAHKDILKK